MNTAKYSNSMYSEDTIMCYITGGRSVPNRKFPAATNSRESCHGKIVPLKKKRSGRIGIAGIPVPPEQFFLKSVIRTWKIDPEVNTYRETYQADR